MKILEWLMSILAWLQIVASPLVAGVLIGFFLHLQYPTTTGLVIGILIAICGLITGIVFATRIWKQRGTINFISRPSASPELDEEKKQE